MDFPPHKNGKISSHEMKSSEAAKLEGRSFLGKKKGNKVPLAESSCVGLDARSPAVFSRVVVFFW